jgi:hypothetical protein
MRLFTLSAVFFLASTVMAAPLDRPSAVRRSQDDETSGLFLRDDAAYVEARSDEYDSFLEARSAKSKANAATRKTNKQAAKAEVAKAGKKGPDKAAAKKAEQKTNAQTKHNQLKAAGAEHKKTSGLPDRNAKYTVPAGNGECEFHPVCLLLTSESRQARTHIYWQRCSQSQLRVSYQRQ